MDDHYYIKTDESEADRLFKQLKTEKFKVREVVNIDWKELWAKTNFTIRVSNKEQIQELVEQALSGEL
jgi:hypothetical protein